MWWVGGNRENVIIIKIKEKKKRHMVQSHSKL